MHLELIVDNSRPISAKPAEAMFYTELLNECRAELQRDLDYYSQRLNEARDCRFSDYAGLHAIFEAHARHIRHLLESIAA